MCLVWVFKDVVFANYLHFAVKKVVEDKEEEAVKNTLPLPVSAKQQCRIWDDLD